MPEVTCPSGFSDRLDRAIARLLPTVSRTRARQLVAAGSVFVDGRRCRVASRRVYAGACLRIEVTEVNASPGVLEILYEDECCIAVAKPAGMPAAPTRQAAAGSVLENLRQQLRRRDGVPCPLWVVHRLDVPASGVLLLAKTPTASTRLGDAFQHRRIGKVYRARVAGTPAHDSGVIELALRSIGQRSVVAPDGRPSRTRWQVLQRDSDSTLLELHLDTGRMHQARVHLSAIGHPILGDRIYGNGSTGRLMLHAVALVFPHPDTGTATQVRAPVPPELEEKES